MSEVALCSRRPLPGRATMKKKGNRCIKKVFKYLIRRHHASKSFN